MKSLLDKSVSRKREQKTSLFLRGISSIIQSLVPDEPALLKVFITKVELAKNYSTCYVYFSTYTDKSDFGEALEILKLYRPSLRKALGQAISGRYVPDLRFVYDEDKEKERKIMNLLDKVAERESGQAPIDETEED